MLMRKVMAEQPAVAVLRQEVAVLQEKEARRSRRGSSDDARDSRDSRGKGGRGNRGESRGGRKSRPRGYRRLQFFQNNDNVKFKGEEPNFEEEGWARRRP